MCVDGEEGGQDGEVCHGEEELAGDAIAVHHVAQQHQAVQARHTPTQGTAPAPLAAQDAQQAVEALLERQEVLQVGAAAHPCGHRQNGQSIVILVET